MASLATIRITLGASLGHASIEFAAVGIHVTGGATQVFKMKRQYFVMASIRAFLVTFIAWNYCVCALQWESRAIMHGDGKIRPVKIVDCMTRFTTVLVRGFRELPVMSVLVAIFALRKFDFINCIRSRGNVAFGAFDAGVLAQQRIRGCGMFLHAKRTRDPSALRVTFRAFSLTRATYKLPLMRIGIMAIHALRVRHRSLEIGVCVAARASDGLVLSQQWILGF